MLKNPVPLSPGCTLIVDPSPALFLFSGAANRTLKRPIPALPSLLNLEVAWQGAVVDSANGNLVTSNALVTKLGLYR